jgi:GDPmannose 4,6-dehydratase
VRQLLDIAFGEAGIDDWSGFVTQDPQLIRPAEVDHLVGDASKARRVLGWKPTVEFADLIRIMVQADLEEQRMLQAQLRALQL